MKMPNLKTLAITAGVTILIVGFIRKQAQTAVKDGKKPEETIAGKIGLI